MIKKAVVLLSGGIDSTTTLAIAQNMGFEVNAITFIYNQRHLLEVKAAQKIAKHLKVEKHLILDIPLNKIGGSALTDLHIPVPKQRDIETGGIPITYVPARNLIFLSFAVAWAEVLNIKDIFIGVNSVDFSGYPDCRPVFIRSFEETANLATKMGTQEKKHIKIHTPLIDMKKSEIIKKGASLGVDFALTLSCYDPDEKGLACGVCDSCLIRKKGFLEANIPDPTKYR